MKQKSLYGQLFSYLVPSVASLVSLSCYILADTYFIANGVGQLGLAALNIALPAYSVINATGLLFGIGAGVLVAVCNGNGDHKKAGEGFRCACLSAVIVGIVITVPGVLFAETIVFALGASPESAGLAAEYIRMIMGFAVFFIMNNTLASLVRNDNAPRLAMLSMVATSLGNVILDYVFVMRFHWGMQGAAFATCLSPIVGILILSTHWMRGNATLHFKRQMPRLSLLPGMLRSGLPNFLMEIGSGLVIYLFNLTLMRLSGDIAVAAYGIVANISLVISYLFMGVGQGMQPVLGQNYGAGKLRNCRKILISCLTFSGILGLLCCLAGQLFPHGLAALFNSEGNAVLEQLTVEGIRIYFAAFLCMGVNICIASYFQSTLRTSLSIVLSILRSLILVMLGVLLLPRLWGITGVWMVVPLCEGITLVIGVTILQTGKKFRSLPDKT